MFTVIYCVMLFFPTPVRSVLYIVPFKAEVKKMSFDVMYFLIEPYCNVDVTQY